MLGAAAPVAASEALLSLEEARQRGQTGLHIYVPVLREYDYDVTRKACELIGKFLLRQRRAKR